MEQADCVMRLLEYIIAGGEAILSARVYRRTTSIIIIIICTHVCARKRRATYDGGRSEAGFKE